MYKNIKWTIIPILGVNLLVNAQLSEIYYDKNYQINTAKDLYNQEAYRGTQYIVNDLINFNHLESYQQEIASFYDALIGLILQDEGAENNYNAFVVKYHQSAMVESSHLQLGNYYLSRQYYDVAEEELSQVNIEKLPSGKRADQYIKLGYAQFMMQDFENAEKSLQKGRTTVKYKKQITYLLGHIAYAKGECAEAKEKFSSLAEDPEFTEKVRPYLVQIYFNDGEYDLAISNGKSLLKQNKHPEIALEISKIIGESEFRKQNYTEAEPYLKTYIQKAQDPTLADYYQMGYVLYQENKYEEAVNYFNKIIVGDISPISQNAYYQLGNSYLKIGKKKEALTAFKAASEMDFDKTIQENAYLNYAKLSYDVGNPYTSVSRVLNEYLKTYPRSEYKQEIWELLIKSYINSGNFAEASQLLDQIPDKSPQLLIKEQEVSYAYGVQLYNQGDIEAASHQFEKAKKLKNNSQYYLRSLYWNADCQYLLGNYQVAIENLNSLQKSGGNIPESQQIPYQKGYAYLKLKKFTDAGQSFEEYLKNPKSGYKSDAELRLADAYLGSNNLDRAVDFYDKVASLQDQDGEYSQYQKALVYGLKNDQKNKIIELEKFVKKYPQSENIVNAYFELGLAYAETENYTKSDLNFQKVIDTSKNNDMVARSYLSKADNSYSQKEYQRAINEYGYIADQYPQTDYALQAVNGAKSAFIEGGRVKEYEIWAKKKGYSINSSDAEELAFLAAEKDYLEKKYTSAAQEFKLFLSNYAHTNRQTTAKYYLGDSYFQLKQYDQAIEVLKPVASSPNEYQEDALYRLSKIYLKQEKENDARLALEALYKITSNEGYKSFVELELMYIYSEEKEYSKANDMAIKVLANSKNPENVKEQASLIKARGLYFSGKLKEARNMFANLEKSTHNSVKAEALYYNALFKSKDKKYDASNTVIYTLTSQYSDQQYWGAKALLIMSDNYYNLKDNYQASYILEQIIANYKEYPDLVSEAQNSLSKIKK